MHVTLFLAGISYLLFVASKLVYLSLTQFVQLAIIQYCLGEFRRREEVQPQKSNMLTTLCGIDKQFHVSFEMLINRLEPGWQSVLLLTQDGNGFGPCEGCKIPVVYINPLNQLDIRAHVNDNRAFSTQVKEFSLGKWFKVEIKQTNIDQKVEEEYQITNFINIFSVFL